MAASTIDRLINSVHIILAEALMFSSFARCMTSRLDLVVRIEQQGGRKHNENSSLRGDLFSFPLQSSVTTDRQLAGSLRPS
jgi:hypothetical protein